MSRKKGESSVVDGFGEDILLIKFYRENKKDKTRLSAVQTSVKFKTDFESAVDL
ncbi:hypothetical protein [uncultured Draconibacterium sp.]|uniref:hypothetical protein n=1 Tax=uncultured Draconibacterium sp. TaxID=1573823 RepID=UPI0025D96F0F|nr:hypothetical protein [uncultured Draconibacterium sp.]